LTTPIRHGELRVADLNPRRGTKAGKLRPVVILQTDLLNDAAHASTFVVPCTTRLDGESLLRVALPKGMAGNTAECEVMIDQGGAIDNRRLRKRLGAVPRPILREIKEKLRVLLDL
jgi:mRNA interferase MazF